MLSAVSTMRARLEALDRDVEPPLSTGEQMSVNDPRRRSSLYIAAVRNLT
jgi:hypothetical protein